MRPRQRRVTVNTEQPGFAYAYYCLGEQVVPHLCSQSLNQEKMAEQAQPCMLTVQVVVQLLSCVQLLRLHGLQPTRLLCPWDFLSKNTRVGYHFLLQGIFLTQGLKRSPALQAGSLIAGGSLSAEPPWKSYCVLLSFSCSLVSSYLQPHGLQHSRLPCPSPSHSLLKLTSIESVMPSSQLVFCHSLLLLPSILPIIKVFSSESVLHIRWPKYWTFSFSISPFSKYSGSISFRIDWFDLHAVQEISQVFSNTTVGKHQFFGAQASLWSNSYIHT